MTPILRRPVTRDDAAESRILTQGPEIGGKLESSCARARSKQEISGRFGGRVSCREAFTATRTSSLKSQSSHFPASLAELDAAGLSHGCATYLSQSFSSLAMAKNHFERPDRHGGRLWRSVI